MVTIKSHSDLQQSKKLVEILSPKSADMCLTFVNNIWNPVWGKTDDIYKLQKDCYEPDYTKDEYVDFDEFEPKVVPCWSLAALRACLPAGINIDGILYVFESHNTFDNEWVYEYKFEDISAPLYSKSSNEIDAAVEMIIQLHKEKFI